MESLAIVVVAWLLLSLIGAVRRAGNAPPKPPSSQKPLVRGSARATVRKRESMFEVFRKQLEQMQQQMDQAGAGPMGRHGGSPLPGAEDVEDRETLDTVAPVRRRGAPVVRKAPVPEDFDLQAERIAQQRIDEAEARNRALNLADHERFDALIREKAVPKQVRRHLTRHDLREAVVWREILGPPVTLR